MAMTPPSATSPHDREAPLKSLSFDAIVVGGGVAGCCAALTLAQRGATVALLEAGRYPRHKVCGEFLSPESRATLRRLGVESALLQSGASPVVAMRVVDRLGRTLAAPLPPGALAISRFRLDSLLWDAALAAGAACQQSCRVRAVERDGGGLFVVHTHDTSWHARAVIDASGRRGGWLADSVTADETSEPIRHLGLKAHFRNVALDRGQIELHASDGAYCGLLRIEDELTDVSFITRYDKMREEAARSPNDVWRRLRLASAALGTRFRRAEQVTPWLSTGNVTFGRQNPTTGDVLCCGDAAGFIHPLTGDGMAMAARSGELAGTVAASALRDELTSAGAAELYDAAWRREFERRLQWAELLEPLLTRPLLTAPAMSLLRIRPDWLQFAIKATRR